MSIKGKEKTPSSLHNTLFPPSKDNDHLQELKSQIKTPAVFLQRERQ